MANRIERGEKSNMKEEKFDIEVIQEGLNQVERLNKKYQNQDFPIFNFIS